MNIGDIIPVEIAGITIGDAFLSEVTDDYVEVVYMGHAIKLPPDVLDYLEIIKEINGVGI